MRGTSPSCRSRRSSSPATSPSSACGPSCRRCSRSPSPGGRRSSWSSRNSRRARRTCHVAASCAIPTSTGACCARSRKPHSVGALKPAPWSTRGCPARRETASSSSISSKVSAQNVRPSSTAGSRRPFVPEPVKRAAVITHGRRETVGQAIERLRAVAADFGVEPVMPPDELEKHDVELAEAEPSEADIVIVLGGDGTMLRALRRLLGTTVPALGVNFGTVGFLTTIPEDELEPGLARVFAGDYELVELPTLEARAGEDRRDAVNDIVATSSTLGRMIELSWSVGGESLGNLRCDGLIVATPSGSTAYNLSNGGPVLVWGLDAMVTTFVAPHSLHARPLVVGRGRDLVVENRTADLSVSVLVDGHAFGDLAPGDGVSMRLGEQRSLLGTLPERTFFRRYRDTFGPV